MVNGSNFAIASTLAGLQRLEAAIQRAMLEAGNQAPGRSKDMNEQNRIKNEAEVHMVRANSVLSTFDLLA